MEHIARLKMIGDRRMLIAGLAARELTGRGLFFVRRLLRRGRIVALVAQTDRMRIAAVAGPAGDLLLADREDACAWKLLIDLPHEQDHFARDIFAGIEVPFLGLAAAVAVVAVHTECVTELTHQRICAMDVCVRR